MADLDESKLGEKQEGLTEQPVNPPAEEPILSLKEIQAQEREIKWKRQWQEVKDAEELDKLRKEQGLPPEKEGAPKNESETSDKPKETVNNFEMKVYSDPDSGDYEISFPGIKIGEEAAEKGVFDQVIKISGNSNTAGRVFEFAKKAAETAKNIYELYLAVEGKVAEEIGKEEEADEEKDEPKK